MKKIIGFSLLLLIILSACNGSMTSPAATITPAQATQTLTAVEPSSTNTALPSEVANRVILVNPQSSNNSDVVEIQKLLQTYASDQNMEFDVIESVNPEQIKSAALIFLLDPEENWEKLVIEHPDTQFITVTDQVVELPSNSFQIYTPQDELIFLAGYTSALISNDWRTAAIVTDQPLNTTSPGNIFTNGVKYLCGLCAPIFAPVVFFPSIAVAAPSSNTSEVLLAYGQIANNRPNVVFIQSQLVSADLITELRQSGITIVGQKTNDPSKNDLLDVSIRYDIPSALKDLLDSKLSGELLVVKTLFGFESQAGYLSAGKLDNLKLVQEDLLNGLIGVHNIAP